MPLQALFRSLPPRHLFVPCVLRRRRAGRREHLWDVVGRCAGWVRGSMKEWGGGGQRHVCRWRAVVGVGCIALGYG